MSTSDTNPADVELPITFRAPVVGVVVWFAICLVIGSVLIFVFLLVGAPLWAQLWVWALVAASFVMGILGARSYAQFTEDGIESRHFRKRRCRWEDVEAWTQWGDRGSTYVRTRSGEILNLSHCNYRSRNRVVREVLTHCAGPETKGKDAVCSKLVRAFFGGLIAARMTEQAEQADRPE